MNWKDIPMAFKKASNDWTSLRMPVIGVKHSDGSVTGIIDESRLSAAKRIILNNRFGC